MIRLASKPDQKPVVGKHVNRTWNLWKIAQFDSIPSLPIRSWSLWNTKALMTVQHGIMFTLI